MAALTVNVVRAILMLRVLLFVGSGHGLIVARILTLFWEFLALSCAMLYLTLTHAPSILGFRAAWLGGISAVFGALVKNTYLTNRPPTRVSANVCRGFAF